MISIAQSVGCDLSKKDFKACICLKDQHNTIKVKASRSFANTAKGFEAFLGWVNKKMNPALSISFVMEATGVYYEALAYFLWDHDLKLSVELPNKTKKYAQSLGQRSKTDRIDARILAQLGLERKLRAWNPQSSNMRRLKKICRQRVRLIEHKTMVNNQLHAELNSFEPQKEIVQCLELQLKQLQKQIQQMEQFIQQLFKTDHWLKAHYQRISKIKGVNLITLATIIAETDGFALFRSRSQLVCYAGYDVVYNESGEQTKKNRISKRGNKFIRRVLHFPAIAAVKHEPRFKTLYNRIFQRRKIKMVAYVAVQRKLLTTIFALFKNQQEYDPQYFRTQPKMKNAFTNPN